MCLYNEELSCETVSKGLLRFVDDYKFSSLYPENICNRDNQYPVRTSLNVHRERVRT